MWRAASKLPRRCSCSWSCSRNRHSSMPTSSSPSAPSAAPAKNSWRRSMPWSAPSPTNCASRWPRSPPTAAPRWLARTPPDLDEVRAALKRLVGDGHRAADAIGSIRAMLRKGGAEQTSIDINELVRGAVTLLHGDLLTLQISVHFDLAAHVPPVRVNRSQLNQVLLNLVKNAADAMNPVADRTRILRIKTASHDAQSV